MLLVSMLNQSACPSIKKIFDLVPIDFIHFVITSHDLSSIFTMPRPTFGGMNFVFINTVVLLAMLTLDINHGNFFQIHFQKFTQVDI